MLDLTILAVGKLKTDYFHRACEEYLKRLFPYARISVEEIKAESFVRDSDREKAKNREGERILKYLAKFSQSEIILLDEGGEEYDSFQFSRILHGTQGRILLVIGGTAGFSDQIQALKLKKIALSKLTFPHELARVVLLEQIFRAVSIEQGKSYHY